MMKTFTSFGNKVVEREIVHSFCSLWYSSETLGFAFTCLLSICPKMCIPCKEVQRLKAT